ncbi:hypothetical protein N658DRAFT_3625 [Parathielavia hyrcaniae]|uniref:Uncharacterized protein n=1 Tax=Parathielavia hyrcaniae TaxID=113614 RepID=A0AAN6QC13_9PEZI|nr:hypothetical protein N658DRAFT_3625 [Parathielavia hyrcaniae]
MAKCCAQRRMTKARPRPPPLGRVLPDVSACIAAAARPNSLVEFQGSIRKSLRPPQSGGRNVCLYPIVASLFSFPLVRPEYNAYRSSHHSGTLLLTWDETGAGQKPTPPHSRNPGRLALTCPSFPARTLPCLPSGFGPASRSQAAPPQLAQAC